MPPNVSGWWTDERVNDTVTSRFVHSHLRPNEAEFLTNSVFGDLSDDTYLEWILTKARRFFLTLCEAGVPDQIFGIIDDSFADDDLPIALDDVPALRLSPQPDAALERRFYKAQFKYLIRVVGDGEHIRYAKEETIPVVTTKSNTGNAPRDSLDKILLPSTTRKTFWRRHVSLGNRLGEEEVLAEIADCRRLAHQHVLSIYGSYTTIDELFVLLTPVAEYNLKSFLNDLPKTFEALSKIDRRQTLINWPHCLASGLAWLHTSARHHGCIRPSRIQIDDQFRICLGQLDGDGILGSNTVKDDIEAYQYAAPERWKRSVTVQKTGNANVSLPSGGRAARKLTLDKAPSFSTGSDMSDPSRRLNTMRPTSTSYAFAPISKGNTTRLRLGRTTVDARHFMQDGNTETRQTHRNTQSRATIRFGEDDEIRPMSPSRHSSESSDNGRTSRAKMMFPTFVAPPELRTAVVQTWQSAQHDQMAADVFSLGAVILDILTILCKHSYSAFAKHRSSKNRVAGRGGGLADASFHANIGQVHLWAQLLHKDAEKRIKKEDGAYYRAVGPILQVIMQCLEREPRHRLSARELETKLHQHIQDFAGILQPHCTWDVDVDDGQMDDMVSEAPDLARENSLLNRGNHQRKHSMPMPREPESDSIMPSARITRPNEQVKIPSQVFEFEFDGTSETAVDGQSMDGRLQRRVLPKPRIGPDGLITALPHRSRQVEWDRIEEDEQTGDSGNRSDSMTERAGGNRTFWVPAQTGRGSYHFPPPPTSSPNRSLPPTPSDMSIASRSPHESFAESHRFSRNLDEFLEFTDKPAAEKQRRSYMRFAPRRNA